MKPIFLLTILISLNACATKNAEAEKADPQLAKTAKAGVQISKSVEAGTKLPKSAGADGDVHLPKSAGADGNVHLPKSAGADGNVHLPKSAKSATPVQAFTMSQLNGAANLLMAAADNGVKTSCNITPEQAMAWINPLHSMIDEKAAKEAEAALKNPKAWIAANQLDTCEKRCECGMWATVLEGAPKAMGRNQRAALQQKAAKQTPAMLQACAAKQADWFCASSLKTDLDLASKK